MNAPSQLGDMREVRLASDQVEVRRARAKIWAGVFGGTPQPTLVGRFEVRERLGAGGMGIVYEAYDPQLDRRVALKVLRADAHLAPDGAARLVEEARAMAKLSHPNVLTVFEAGTVDEQVFIAMALVEGFTLRSWLDAQTRTPTEVMAVMRAAGRGLQAAHEAGLVHRDFKPENVLVSREGAVFVTDFGLARSFVAEESGGWRRSASGLLTTKMAGTPAYMAPEQLRGRSVDARCDQFAWCVTAYEALVGRRPYPEVVLQGMALESRFEPEPVVVPSEVSVPRRVRVALERGLSVDPDERFPSLAELLDAVRPRSKAWVPMSVGLGVAAVGLGIAAWPEDEACPPQPQLLDAVWGEDTQAQVREVFLASKMPYAERAWGAVQGRADVFARQWVGLQQQACRQPEPSVQRCLQRRRDELGALTRLFRDADAGVVERSVAMISAMPALSDCADAVAAAAVIEDDAGQPDGARAAVDDARVALLAGHFADAQARVGDALAALEPGDPLWLEASALQGDVAMATADEAASNAAFERVLAHASGDRGQTHVAAAAVGLVEVQAKLAKTDFDAAGVLARAAKIAVASAGNPPRLRARLESAQANLAIAKGEFDDGIARVEGAQAILEELGDDTVLERANLMALASKALYRKQRLDDAERLANTSLSLLRNTLGPEHPSVAKVLLVPASVALARGDIGGAQEQFQQVADILAATVGRDHVDYGAALVSLASSVRVGGDYERARTLNTEAVEVLGKALAPDHMRVLVARLNLAALEHELGNLEVAQRMYREILVVQRETLGEHYEVSMTLANLARVLEEVGDNEGAREAAEASLKIRRAVFGEQHDKTLAVRLLLAEVLMSGGGSPTEAAATFAELRTLREAGLGPTHPGTTEVIVLQAKAALRGDNPADALAFAEEGLLRRTEAGRPDDELDVFRVLVVLAARATGDLERAEAVAAAVVLEGRLSSELRGWCDEDCKAAIATKR